MIQPRTAAPLHGLPQRFQSAPLSLSQRSPPLIQNYLEGCHVICGNLLQASKSQKMTSAQTEELWAMERSFQEQARIRQAKLANARKLVAEMEFTLSQLSDMVSCEPPSSPQSLPCYILQPCSTPPRTTPWKSTSNCTRQAAPSVCFARVPR